MTEVLFGVKMDGIKSCILWRKGDKTMTSRERVIEVYNIFEKEYGEEIAQKMLITILMNEQEYSDLTFEEANELYNELHK